MSVLRGFVRAPATFLARRCSSIVHVATQARGVNISLNNGNSIYISDTREARDAVCAIFNSSEKALQFVPLTNEERQVCSDEELELVGFRY